jgi:hypothetical protein
VRAFLRRTAPTNPVEPRMASFMVYSLISKNLLRTSFLLNRYSPIASMRAGASREINVVAA